MLRQLTLADFDARERIILAKLEVYFDGLAGAPLVVNRDDHLIDFTLLEETGVESENPVGAISANELTFTLFNTNKIFSPSNAGSPYAGKIGINVPVKAFLYVEGTEPESLGTFYVDTWNTAVGSSTVNVSCTDLLRRLLERPMPPLPIVANETYADFFRRIFSALGVHDVVIDATLDKRDLKYAYSNYGLVIDTLQPVAEAAMCYIYVGRDNRIYITDLLRKTAPVATLTDSNQIKTVDIPQSILKTYSTVELEYSAPSISPDIEVLGISNASFVPGAGQLSRYKVSNGPVFTYTYLSVTGTLSSTVHDMHCSAWEATLDTRNTMATHETGDISIVGKVVQSNKTTITKENQTAIATIGVKPLSVANMFIQDPAYADLYANVLLNFITSEVPVLEVGARGNPKLLLCDTVAVNDVMHGIAYEAKIIRAEYRYAGSLSCDYTLLNTEVLNNGLE